MYDGVPLHICKLSLCAGVEAAASGIAAMEVSDQHNTGQSVSFDYVSKTQAAMYCVESCSLSQRGKLGNGVFCNAAVANAEGGLCFREIV